ncbi:PEP-CTERM sorting domain-containing protein [Aestuariibacter sp. AA17]|uniref:PEP-CTERM sorting domain-containing protein n=1 Tax=Fluctibacter corallii TaxID=2984329 RepID=A0ABT3A4N1_9ALTE|nr:exosortase-dependent surface protein XDP1 [Aestuariibacter sp. AA17]MCV2883192.1 PEP-CTERM sorting domain-containing protein [Aestuariibacter sp. AA17]
MLKQFALSAALLISASSALASTQTWDFANNSGNSLSYGNTSNNVGTGSYMSLTDDNIDLVVTGWSSTSSSGSCAPGDASCNRSHSGYDGGDPFLRRGELKLYSGGLGVINGDEGDDNPNHSFDSMYGSSRDFDAALLQFDEKVMLDEIDVDWIGNDSDISVLRYTGQKQNGSPFSTSDTWASLLTKGWEVVENISDMPLNGYYSVAESAESYYWLVGVYNPVFGGALSAGNDAFKLAAVTTTKTAPPPTSVPEPATLILMLAGLLGLRRLRA